METSNRSVAVMLTTVMLALSSCGEGNVADSPVKTQDQTSSPVTESDNPATAAFNSNRLSRSKINLAWDIPLARTDGTPMAVADIGGYEITYTNSAGSTSVVNVGSPLQTSMSLELPSDTYAFNIFAYDSSNQLSPPSQTVVIQVGNALSID